MHLLYIVSIDISIQKKKKNSFHSYIALFHFAISNFIYIFTVC